MELVWDMGRDISRDDPGTCPGSYGGFAGGIYGRLQSWGSPEGGSHPGSQAARSERWVIAMGIMAAGLTPPTRPRKGTRSGRPETSGTGSSSMRRSFAVAF